MTFKKNVLRSTVLSAAFLTLAAVVPASAQQWGPGYPPPDYSGRIPPQHIEAMVRSMGFQPVAEPRPRGPLWVTHAVDRDGQQVRVLIDSFSGRVIDVLRRPLPPQRVAAVPPSRLTPQANGPIGDYDDEGPDYDYRDVPRQRPADWPPSRPNAQQQGPQVIPYEPRSDNRVPSAPKSTTAKKKETKKKNDTTAALPSEKEKQNTASPKSRPADAPKSAETPTFVPNADQRPTGSILPPAQTLEMNENRPASGTPPVQPPF